MKKKTILFISGTRADFGKLKPLINGVKKSSRLDYNIFITGMHMIDKYGKTINEVYKSGFQNVIPFKNSREDEEIGMDLALANTVTGLNKVIVNNPPDLIIIHGDRLEALAGAIVGSFNNILVGHIEGGEVSGTIDELIRHSVSKLSHIHFVSNEIAKKRLLKMGENEKSIFITGSPDIDIMLSDNLPKIEEVMTYYDINFESYSVFCYHPVTTEIDSINVKIESVINALVKSQKKYVIILPNNDIGSDIIIKKYDSISANINFRILPSLRFEFYLTLLKNADLIIGNSSAGIREAPVFGVPTINIGTRQNNRFEFHSITNVSEDEKKILDAISSPPKVFNNSLHFGEGNSAKKFIDILKNNETWKTPMQKYFNDHD